jgi:hypothetical protein
MDVSLAVIVPSYNHAIYLPDLFASLFGGVSSLGDLPVQNLLPTEVIVVDDCSTDNTEEIVKKYSSVKYLRTPVNSGSAAACNLAIQNTQCEFIARIDADDMREWWSLERMYEEQSKNPTNLIYDNMRVFHDGARVEKEWKFHDYDFYMLLERNIIHSGIMFPRKAWELCGGYREKFGIGRDDWSFNVALGSVGCCGLHIEGAGYLYRREKQNRTLTNTSPEWQERFHLLMREEFPDLYSGRFSMSCCGGRARSRNSSGSNPSSYDANSPMRLAGSQGMTLVRYMGENDGKQTFFGAVTGAAYTFSKSKNLGNIDNRDLSTNKNTGIMDLMQYQKPLFEIQERHMSSPAPVPVPAQSNVKETPLKPVEKPVEDIVAHPINPGDVEGVGKKSVDKLKFTGIDTWEKFMSTDNLFLSVTTGMTESKIEDIKKALTE